MLDQRQDKCHDQDWQCGRWCLETSRAYETFEHEVQLREHAKQLDQDCPKNLIINDRSLKIHLKDDFRMSWNLKAMYTTKKKQ